MSLEVQKREDVDLALPARPLESVVLAHLYDRLGPKSRPICVNVDPDKDGVIILTGEVSTFYTKQMAWQIAEKTKGVRSVVDQLVVVDNKSKRSPEKL